MLDLATVPPEVFTPALHEIFRLVEGEKSYDLELVEVRLLGARQRRQNRDPFALVFQGKPGLRALQHIYRLESSGLGAMEIFLTQVGDGPEGSSFEAVFN